ncbi:hypothetical protein [Tychonema sp. LEGE 07203]|uniref:hypothetical protein n=1 Tax=Tychonema sp. LEGE 07203 TaxID=1828671 RepID=UPI00188206D8|nr:hypothetical protein [Tychonema sp. LEGE 07203]MBE9096862.1 hypothetical protein [Tychonema sp. LEGE 07203]
MAKYRHSPDWMRSPRALKQLECATAEHVASNLHCPRSKAWELIVRLAVVRTQVQL